MLPTATLTYIIELSGNSTTTAITPPCTILGYEIMQENLASDTAILDGTSVLFRNYAKSTEYVPVNHICQDSINIIKSGNDTALITINYLPYSVTPSIFQQMGYGDILISFFLFLIILGSMFGFIINNFVKYHKR